LPAETNLWNRCIRDLQAELPEQQFNTWIRPLQAVEDAGQLRLLRGREPIDAVLAEASTDGDLRDQLELVRSARSFAAELGLTVGGQYTSYVDWPGEARIARVRDLSPVGMRCIAECVLEPGDVVKITAPAFDAVGAVAHSQPGDGHSVAGLRFLAVRFREIEGNFVSVKL